MKRKVEITHCFPIVDNYYNLKKEDYTIDIVTNKIYMEVESIDEVRMIDNIERWKSYTYQEVNKLVEYLDSKHN